MLHDEEMMRYTLSLAKKAYEIGEVPVGAVILSGSGEIIGTGFNTTERMKSPLMHAEMTAISEASKKLQNWRLTGSTIYVTLEPCPMCAGAIRNARISRVVYGAFDEKNGALSTDFNLYDRFNENAPLIKSRVLERECAQLLSDFFKQLR